MGEALHSQLVASLKVLLPLTALGLLSTMFMLSRTVTSNPDVPFLNDVSEIPEGDSIMAPFYTGSTPEGHAVTVTAATARPEPDDPAGIVADRLNARFDMTDGSRINIAAGEATVNEPADRLVLRGSVVIESSTGYSVRTDFLEGALRSVKADAPGRVAATGPIGELTAGSFRIREGATEGAVQLFFTNGVKLIYEPANVARDGSP